jgi:hypothetical protein
MSPWVFLGVLILIAGMVAAVLVVATQAFLDTRVAGKELDSGGGDSFHIVGGVRRGWMNYTWPGGELEVADLGVVLSGPGFRVQGQWDAMRDVQMLRTIFGWGIRFRLSADRQALTFWVRQRRYADKVIAAARKHGVTIKPPSRFSI